MNKKLDELIKEYKELHEAEQMMEAGDVLNDLLEIKSELEEKEVSSNNICDICWMKKFACSCKF